MCAFYLVPVCLTRPLLTPKRCMGAAALCGIAVTSTRRERSTGTLVGCSLRAVEAAHVASCGTSLCDVFGIVHLHSDTDKSTSE